MKLSGFIITLFFILATNRLNNMATITNKTDGIEIVDSHGDTYFIKYANCKLIKRDILNIYDNSERRLGAAPIRLNFAEVTSPATANLDALYTTIRNYID